MPIAMGVAEQHTTSTRRRVLFMGEAVTLAHVARPFALARALPKDRFDVTVACDARVHGLAGDGGFALRAHASASSEAFLTALAKGAPLHDERLFAEQVELDRALISELKPDVVVGDFRLSLGISAAVERVPYVAISNAHWSPHAVTRYPLPDLPVTRALGPTLAAPFFHALRPLFFALTAAPVNAVRKRYGLRSLGGDLRVVYSHADFTAYADVPELVPTLPLPPNHRFIGPVLWSPPGAEPTWWRELPDDRPLVYVSLGSSGNTSSLPPILEALGRMPVTAAVATASRIEPKDVPANVFVAPYLPGERAAARAAVTVSNGGVMTVHQALAAGRPIIGVASNMDQHLCMGAVVRARAGLLLRSDALSAPKVEAALNAVLHEPAYREVAQGLATTLSQYPSGELFRALLEQAC